MFTLDGFVRGARRALPIGLSGIPFGLVLGVLAGRAGLSVLEVLLMSSLVFAGSSQLVALSMWANPIPVIAIVATTLLVNVRHVLMGLTLRPWYAKLPAPLAYGTYYFMTDESWALTTIETERKPFDAAFLLGAGLVDFVSWVGSTAIGRITGAAIPDPSSWGLDFAFVAVFLALLVSLARGKQIRSLVPWLVAAIVAIAGQRLIPGNWYVLLGAASGVLSGLVLRRAHA
jgi:4-azaleucine resistance transporter AzlC